ncbi:MAG TPA: tail fiber domain-containing protein [Candidatus Paceibacterota bacterium]|nr:tail fiber domain-containing protein [Candidatus Paceibacterota bacterium]
MINNKFLRRYKTAALIGVFVFVAAGFFIGSKISFAAQTITGTTINATNLNATIFTVSQTNSTVGLANSTIIVANPSGTQSMQYFTFGGVQKSSLRADSTGNFIINANSGNIYLNDDFGGTPTIVPVNSVLNISGTLAATTLSGSYSGTMNAANLSAGAFGSNTGGGNYSFPASVGIGTTGPGAKLDIVASTPTGVGALPSGVTQILQSNTDNLIGFNNTADNGTWAGLVMNDNNQGGYVAFKNYPDDWMHIGGYQGVSIEAGAQGFGGKPAVATFTPSGESLTGNLSISGTYNGSGAGLTGTAGSLSIGGTSAATNFVNGPDGDRNAATKLPTTSGHGVRFDFVGAGSAGGGGNYSGLMTYAPWDGTSGSTGDASYQISFNSPGTNASGVPYLNIRNGIDSTWNSWYTMLNSGNYNSYSPTLTGGGASGTWGITASLANGVNQYPNRTDGSWYQINWNNAAAGDHNLYSSAAVTLLSSGYGAIGFNGSAWYIQGNASYGLYSNTGLDAAGGLWDAGNRVYSASNVPNISTFPNNSGYVTSGSAPTFGWVYGTGFAMGGSSAQSIYNVGVNMWMQTTGDINISPGSGDAVYLHGTTFVYSTYTCTIGNSSSVSCVSDKRLKKNIEPISGTDALNKLSLINGVTFNWADPAKPQKENIGVIAQDVLKAFPQVVGTVATTFDGVKGNYYTVDYATLVAPLISGVNELHKRTDAITSSVASMTDAVTAISSSEKEKDKQIAEMQNKIDAQQKTIADLQTRVSALEKK